MPTEQANEVSRRLLAAANEINEMLDMDFGLQDRWRLVAAARLLVLQTGKIYTQTSFNVAPRVD